MAVLRIDYIPRYSWAKMSFKFGQKLLMPTDINSIVVLGTGAGVLTYFAGARFCSPPAALIGIVLQRKNFNHIDFAFLRNRFLSCASNTIIGSAGNFTLAKHDVYIYNTCSWATYGTINHASYEMCMRKIQW